jgi:uncharacterized membrane protein SirB2
MYSRKPECRICFDVAHLNIHRTEGPVGVRHNGGARGSLLSKICLNRFNDCPLSKGTGIQADMDPKIYQFLHVISIILLSGFTFAIAANPQKHKKKLMAIVTGILGLVALVAGAGLMSKVHDNNWGQVWVVAKLACWLVVMGLGGMAYKKSKSFIFTGLIAALGIAVFMVYFPS